jgi:hypothetical protein
MAHIKQRAKKREKNITSEKMNQVMPQRNERSSCELYKPGAALFDHRAKPAEHHVGHSRLPTKKISGPWDSGRAALRSLNHVPSHTP